MKSDEGNYACPCCGYLTFDEKPSGSFKICPVCYWEDDLIQNEDPSYSGGANEISLNQAKKNFSEYGAIKRDFISHVRKPFKEELPKS